MQTCAWGKCSLAERAAKNPAAPPPMMVIFKVMCANELQDTEAYFKIEITTRYS
jgi:hypothetical protein